MMHFTNKNRYYYLTVMRYIIRAKIGTKFHQVVPTLVNNKIWTREWHGSTTFKRMLNLDYRTLMCDVL